MKVREFFRSFSLASVIAALVLSLAVLPTVGCINQSQIAALTQVLGTSAQNIATLEGNTVLAAQLKADTAAAVTAIDNWKTGTPAATVIEALNIVEADLNLIPGTSQYIPLVDLAIATVQGILALLPQPAVPVPAVKAVRTVNLGHPSPKTAKQFKQQWAAIIAANPSLAPAAIQ